METANDLMEMYVVDNDDGHRDSLYPNVTSSSFDCDHDERRQSISTSFVSSSDDDEEAGSQTESSCAVCKPSRHYVSTSDIRVAREKMEKKFIEPNETLLFGHKVPKEKQGIIKHLVDSRKRTWNLMNQQHKYIDKSVNLFQMINQKMVQHSQCEKFLAELQPKLQELRKKVEDHNNIPFSDLTPEQRQIDETFVQEETQYSKLYNDYMIEIPKEIEQLRKLANENASQLVQNNFHIEILENDARRKRARLDVSTHSLKTKDIEHLLFSQEVDYQNQLAEKIETYETILARTSCSLCYQNDSINQVIDRTVMPCCMHIVCTGCVDKMVAMAKNTDQFNCPCCRKPVERLSLKPIVNTTD